MTVSTFNVKLWTDNGWQSDGTEPVIFEVDFADSSLTRVMIFDKDTHVEYHPVTGDWSVNTDAEL